MKVQVRNRSNAQVIYSLPEDGVRREFAPGEMRMIDSDELERLTYKPGGKELIRDYLLVTDPETVKNTVNQVQPEYWMSDEEVINLLKTGSLDAFKDCLDFAPVGVLDLVKKYAVSLPLNDNAKREAMKKQINFDVDTALRLIDEEKKDVDSTSQVAEEVPIGRRVKAEPAKKTAESKYKVISREG